MLRVLFLMLIPFAVIADDAAQGITVAGKATIYAQPDVYKAEFSIIERNTLASSAKLLVDDKTNMLINAAKSLGINNDKVDSSAVSVVQIKQEPSIRIDNVDVYKRLPNNDLGKVSVNKGTQQTKKRSDYFMQVSRTIVIELDDISQYDKLLDRAVKIEVERIKPLKLSFSAPEQLYQQALEQAIDNAKSKAQRLAKKSGVTLGQLLSLEESSHYAPQMSRLSESHSQHTSQVTKRPISAQVHATFAIEP